MNNRCSVCNHSQTHDINLALLAGTTLDTLKQQFGLSRSALHRHKPQMIFISAGFDAHRDDPLGGLSLVEDDYAWITKQVMAVADEHAQGRIVSSLEGGYDLHALARSASAHIRTLAGLD